MVNGVTYFCVYIPDQGACSNETSVFSNAVRFALKLLFGTKNNQLHDHSLFLQNDAEVLDLPTFLLPQPIASFRFIFLLKNRNNSVHLPPLQYTRCEKLKSLSLSNLLPPE